MVHPHRPQPSAAHGVGGGHVMAHAAVNSHAPSLSLRRVRNGGRTRSNLFHLTISMLASQPLLASLISASQLKADGVSLFCLLY
ncbi:hypothetical protein NL676_011132 [Syzygium grande]|nr:hypothetical protein NL676_011132 [Syzygium grande]